MQYNFIIPIFITMFIKCQSFTHNDTLWAIEGGGHIALINLNTGEQAPLPYNHQGVLTIAQDFSGNIFLGDNHHCIKKYDLRNKSWETIYKYPDTLLGMAFDRKNQLYLFTSKGIVDITTSNTYFPASSSNPQLTLTQWRQKPVSTTDIDGNIWLGFAYGEWGGDIQVFNTTTKEFCIPDLNGFEMAVNPISSLSQNDKSVIATTDMNHLSRQGAVIQFINHHLELLITYPNDTGVTAGTTSGNDIFYATGNGAIYKGNKNNWSLLIPPSNEEVSSLSIGMNKLIILTRKGELLLKDL